MTIRSKANRSRASKCQWGTRAPVVRSNESFSQFKKIYHPRPFGTAGEARFRGVWDDESHLRVARMRNEDSRAPRDLQDTRLWEEALSKVLARIEATASTIKHGYPHYADTNTGRWTVSENGDWTGGFWNGMLWLAYHVTSDNRYCDWARLWTERLRLRASSETVFRGFLFYYGAALGEILCEDDLARNIGIEGARGLATLFAKKLASFHLAVQRRRRTVSARAKRMSTECSRALCWTPLHPSLRPAFRVRRGIRRGKPTPCAAMICYARVDKAGWSARLTRLTACFKARSTLSAST
jgi:hypothetical protein